MIYSVARATYNTIHIENFGHSYFWHFPNICPFAALMETTPSDNNMLSVLALRVKTIRA